MKETVKVTRNQYVTLSTYLNEILDDYDLDVKDRLNIVYRFKTHMKLYKTDENVEEIQRQENLPTLKVFDIEKAKAGAKLCTRVGQEARILCYDLKNELFPIAAAIKMGDCENPLIYTANGTRLTDKTDKLDLMIVPTTREGWVNIYQYATDPEYCVYGPIYKTKEEAEKNCVDNYLTTTKITWEV